MRRCSKKHFVLMTVIIVLSHCFLSEFNGDFRHSPLHIMLSVNLLLNYRNELSKQLEWHPLFLACL